MVGEGREGSRENGGKKKGGQWKQREGKGGELKVVGCGSKRTEWKRDKEENGREREEKGRGVGKEKAKEEMERGVEEIALILQ